MGLGPAAVGSAAQPGPADGLGDGALHAGADVVAGFPLCGLLLGALPGEQFVLLAGQQGQAASPLAVCRLGAPGPQRARAAVSEREVDPGNGGAVGFALAGPADADRSLGQVTFRASQSIRKAACGRAGACPALLRRVWWVSAPTGPSRVMPWSLRAARIWPALM